MRHSGEALTTLLPLLLSALTITVIGCGPDVDDSGTPEGMARVAEELLESGRYEEALEAWRGLLERFPEHRDTAEWHLGESRTLLAMGMADQAFQSAARAEQSARFPSTLGRARLLQIEILVAQGRNEEALGALTGLSMENLDTTDGARAESIAIAVTAEVGTGLLTRARQDYSGWLDLFMLLELEHRSAAAGDIEHALLYGAEIDRLFPDARDDYPRPDISGPEKPFVALLMPLTGEGSVWGQEVARGAELAFARFADLYADAPELVQLDTGGATGSEADLFSSVVANPSCVAVIGPLTSAATLVVGRIAHENGLPVLTPTATSQDIDEMGGFVHRLVPACGDEAAAVAEYAVRQDGRSRIAILHPYNAEAVAEAGQFQRTAERMGATIVAVEGYEVGDTDFRDQIRTIKSYSPDAVFLPVSAWDAIQIAPQLRFYSLEVAIYGTSGWDNEMVPRLGEEYVEGAVFTVSFGGSSVYPPSARFSYLYRRQHGKEPSREAAQGYDSATLVLKAWESPPHTRSSIEVYLSQLDYFDGVLGRVTLRARDLPRISHPLVKIEDGEIIRID